MKKVFISQPMGGMSDEDILKARQDAIYEIRNLIGHNFEVVDSVLTECCRGPIWCLGRSICMIEQADMIYFASGWENARGCRIEHEVAEQYGVKII